MALFFVVLMSIENFAAVVGDSDGAAFVTKGDFESLKEEFDKKIDEYNNSLNQKVDGAIANYLSGLKVEEWEQMKLDPNSKYLFPLHMCGPDNEWNNPNYKSDTQKHYFDLMVPYYDLWEAATMWGRNGGGGGGGAGQGLWKNYNGMPAPLPIQTHDADNQIVRVSKVNKIMTYPGYAGTLNLLTRTTETRKINGTDRRIFIANTRGFGQLKAYNRGNACSNYWDGNAEYEVFSDHIDGKVYNYPEFVGLKFENFNNSGGKLLWVTASGTKTVVRDWSRPGCWGPHGINGNVKNMATRSDLTNVEDALSYLNSALFVETDRGRTMRISAYDDDSNRFPAPYLVLPEWQHTAGTNTCYYGTANMQGNLNLNGGQWGLRPVQGTSARNQKIDKIIMQDQSRNNVSIFNFSETRAFTTFAPFIPNYIWYVPYWVARPNDSWSEQTDDNFSQLRASIVKYVDKNGKDHFLDEGMYLGTSDKNDATIKFRLTFADVDSWSVDIALSKSPFDYDAVTSDQLAFTWSQVGNPTIHNVAKGGTARLNCNSSYNIEIDSIAKDDMLFLKWTPATVGHYVELKSLDDFYIRGK